MYVCCSAWLDASAVRSAPSMSAVRLSWILAPAPTRRYSLGMKISCAAGRTDRFIDCRKAVAALSYRRVAISLSAETLRSFATLSIASRSLVASTVAGHTALLAILKTSQVDGGGGSGLRGMRQVSAAKYVGSRLAAGLGEARGGAGGLLKRRPALGCARASQVPQYVLILKGTRGDERSGSCAG